MFKALETESDDEEDPDVKTTLDSRRFGADSEWIVVKAKNISKHKKQDE